MFSLAVGFWWPLVFLLKKSIEKKIEIFDFLRGNERYKYDLGAKDKLLYKVIIDL